MTGVIAWNNIIDGSKGFEQLARDYVQEVYKYPNASWNETPQTHDGNKDGYIIIVGYHPENIIDDEVWWMEAKYINETEQKSEENIGRKNQSNKYLRRFKLDATIVSSIFNQNVTRIVFVTNVEVKAKVISDVRTALSIATNCKETFFCTKHLLEYWLCTHTEIYQKYFGSLQPPILNKESLFVSDDIEIYGNVSNMKLAQPLQHITTNRIYEAYCKVISGQNQKISIHSAQKGIHIVHYNLKHLVAGENLLHITFKVTDKYFEREPTKIQDGDGYKNLSLFKLNRSVNLTTKKIFSITQNQETHLDIESQKNFLKIYSKLLSSRYFCCLIDGESGVGKTTIMEECIDREKKRNYNTYYLELQDDQSTNLLRLINTLFFVLFPFIYVDDLTEETIKSRKLDANLTNSLLILYKFRNKPNLKKIISGFVEKKYVISIVDEYNNGCSLFIDNVHKLDSVGISFLSSIIKLFAKFKLHIILATQPTLTEREVFKKEFTSIILQRFSFRLSYTDIRKNLEKLFGFSLSISNELADSFFPNLIVFNLFVQHANSLNKKIATIDDLMYIYISFRNDILESPYIQNQLEDIQKNYPDAWTICLEIYKNPMGIPYKSNNNTGLLIEKRLIKQNDYGNLVPIHDIYVRHFRKHFRILGNSSNELDLLDQKINSLGISSVDEQTYVQIHHLRQTEQFYSVEYLLSEIYSTGQKEKYLDLWGNEMFYLLYFEYSYAAVQNSHTSIGYDGFEEIFKAINGSSSKRLNILQLEVIFELINSHFNVGEYSTCKTLFKKFNYTYDRLVDTYGIDPDKNTCLFYVLSNNYMLYIDSEEGVYESFKDAEAQRDFLKKEYPFHYVDFLFRYGRTLFIHDWNTACDWIERAMQEVKNHSNKQGLLVTFYSYFTQYVNEKEGICLSNMYDTMENCKKSFYSSYRHMNLLYSGLLYIKGYVDQADTLLFQDIARARKIRTKMNAEYKQILALHYLRHNNIKEARSALIQSVDLFSFNPLYQRISQHNLEVIENANLKNIDYEICRNEELDSNTIYLDPRVY